MDRACDRMKVVFMASWLQWDGDFLLWVQENLRVSGLTPFMKAITVLGNAGVFWIALTFLMFFFKRTRRAAFASTVALILVYISCNLITKNLVARTRPYEVVEGLVRLTAAPRDYSFPSGHTAIGFGSAVALFFYLDRRLGVTLLGLATLIAWTRLYLGVHYPTDILGGLAFGIVMGILGHLVEQRVHTYLEAREEKMKVVEADEDPQDKDADRR